MYYRGVIIMTISIRLNEEDAKLIKSYAKINKTTISEFVRKAVLEKIEDEYDLECYYKAMEEFKKNPKTYTHEEVKRMLNIE